MKNLKIKYFARKLIRAIYMPPWAIIEVLFLRCVALFLKPIYEDIIDITLYPTKTLAGFTHIEVQGLFTRIPNFTIYDAGYYTKPYLRIFRQRIHWLKTTKKSTFRKRKKYYATLYPETAHKIKFLGNKYRKYKINLAYVHFLTNVYLLLPFFNRNKIPFVFLLHPGGGFGLNIDNDPEYFSDFALKEVCKSPYFKTVIVTQMITYHYLVDKGFCAKEKIAYLFGGYANFTLEEADIGFSQKKYAKKDKDTFDLCFCAFKYSEQGVDKGYDLFIGAAKELLRNPNNKMMQFHVIGPFDETDIDVSEIKENIYFHGLQDTKWLKEFYPNCDLALAPTRPFQLYKGNFDGYPMLPDQSLMGVAMFNTDILDMNALNGNLFIENEEIVTIKPNIADIAEKIQFYFDNLDLLYALALKGRLKAKKLFNNEARLEATKNILLKAANKHEK